MPHARPVMRANFFTSMAQYTPNQKWRFNNCNNTLCYTYNHNYISNPNNANARIGNTSLASRVIRKRA